MASARYWRLRCTQADGDTSFQVADIAVYDVYGGSNIANGGTAIGSAGDPGNAFDGNTSTVYTAALPGWIGYDFGSAVDPLMMSVSLGVTTSRIPTIMYVDSSGNGSDWTEILRVTSGATSAGATIHFPMQTEIVPIIGNPVIIGATGAASQTLSVHVLQEHEMFRAYPRSHIGTAGWLCSPATATITAEVLENGQPVMHAVTRVLHRPSGMPAGGGFTDAAGMVTIDGLAPNLAEYVVIAFDPEGGAEYNAVVRDRITAT